MVAVERGSTQLLTLDVVMAFSQRYNGSVPSRNTLQVTDLPRRASVLCVAVRVMRVGHFFYKKAPRCRGALEKHWNS